MDTLTRTISVRERIRNEANIVTREQRTRTIYLPSQFARMTHRQYPAKRAFDLILASIGFFFFAILFPFIAIGIKLSSPGPVLFRQKRTGLNGSTFTCYKFRTMTCNRVAKNGSKPDITKKGDARIFAFGRFLRKCNLDELPQILNVLKGEMSLVGPRPYPVEECAFWNTAFDDFYYRYAVKPGLTGYAQVKGYRGGTLDISHMRKRTDLDLIYTQKNSLILDIKVVAATVLQMLRNDTNAH